MSLIFVFLPIVFVVIAAAIITLFMRRKNSIFGQVRDIQQQAFDAANKAITKETEKDKPIFCSYCGAKNDRTDKKCSSCGSAIKE